MQILYTAYSRVMCSGDTPTKGFEKAHGGSHVQVFDRLRPRHRRHHVVHRLRSAAHVRPSGRWRGMRHGLHLQRGRGHVREGRQRRQPAEPARHGRWRAAAQGRRRRGQPPHQPDLQLQRGGGDGVLVLPGDVGHCQLPGQRPQLEPARQPDRRSRPAQLRAVLRAEGLRLGLHRPAHPSDRCAPGPDPGHLRDRMVRVGRRLPPGLLRGPRRAPGRPGFPREVRLAVPDRGRLDGAHGHVVHGARLRPALLPGVGRH